MSTQPNKYLHVLIVSISSIYALGLVFCMILLFFLTPAAAWDFVSFWGDLAVKFLNGLEVSDLAYQMGRHPVFPVRYLVSNLGMLPWLIVLFASAIAIMVYLTSYSLPLAAASLFLACFFPPLSENMIALPGYMEGLSSIIFSAGLLLLLTIHGRETKLSVRTIILLACFSGFFLGSVLKAGGFIPLVLLSLSAFAAQIYLKKGWVFTLLFVLSSMASFGGIVYAISLGMINWLHPYLFYEAEINAFTIGGRLLYLRWYGLEDMFAIYKQTFFQNSSFSIAPSLWVLMVCLSQVQKPLTDEQTFANALSFFHLVCLLAICFLALCTDYGYRYSGNNDTSFSRLLLPIVVIQNILIINAITNAYRSNLTKNPQVS